MKQKSGLVKRVITREILYRLGLAIFGFSLFPGIVFLVSKIFFAQSTTISAFYTKFYSSLLDLGIDGLFSWCIACAPYLAYDICLLIKTYRIRKIKTLQKDDQSGRRWPLMGHLRPTERLVPAGEVVLRSARERQFHWKFKKSNWTEVSTYNL